MYEILRFHSEDERETVVETTRTLGEARKVMKAMAKDVAGKDGKVSARNGNKDVWVDFGTFNISFRIDDTRLADKPAASDKSAESQMIDGKVFAAKVNRVFSKENGMKMVDSGYRVRQTPECLQYGLDVIEVSSSFFYRSQANMDQAVGNVLFYGHQVSNLGFELDDLVKVRDMQEEWQAWPKTSWMSALYRITEAEYYEDEAEWSN